MDGNIFHYVFAGCLVLSLALLVISIIIGKARLASAALIFSIPVSVLMMGYPALFYVPAIFPLLIYLGGNKLETKNKKAAIFFFSPYLIIATAVLLFGFVLDVL